MFEIKTVLIPELARQIIHEAKINRSPLLDLGNCGLKEIPEEVFELVWLEQLNLGNWFYNIQEQKFQQTKNDKSRNSIVSIPWEIRKLRNLQSLSLSENQVTDIGNVRELKQLTRLHLAGNQIRDISPVADLTELTLLELAHNQITDINPVKRLINLTFLDLFNNKIGDASPVKELYKITELYLSKNRIAGINPVANLTGLTRLGLASNQVTDIYPVRQLAKLTYLDLYGNQIRDISPVKELAALGELYISGNQIGDISPVAGLTGLTRLGLSANPVNDINALKELKNLAYLDLCVSQVRDISALKGLTKLTELYLSNNLIADISPLAGLNELTRLELFKNQVSDISHVRQLRNLSCLNLYNNQIRDIGPVKELSRLTELYLANNQVADISPVSDLTKLTRLGLSCNQVSNLDPLKGLANLVFLDLYGNQVRDIGPLRTIIEKRVPVKWHNDNKEKGIILGNNPLTTPPSEIVNEGNEAILDYFTALEEQDSEYVYEAKLLIIGEGGVGKTTLAGKLIDKDAPAPGENDTTRGIAINPYRFTLPDGNEFNVNIWDFGGQEIYYATHQIFFTRRSLYVLVDNTRKNGYQANDSSFDYWLKRVALLGGGSPLLIVQNENGERTKELDIKGMKLKYDFLVEEKLAANFIEGTGLDKVRKAIQKYIQQLPHVGQRIPKNWIAVRKDLEELAIKRACISPDEYLQICEKHDIRERKKALELSSFLHDLGVFLHFQDSFALMNLIILNNQWATDAVYKVLDNQKIKNAHGRFNRANLDSIWSDPKYEFHHKDLISLMTKFELCYSMENNGEEAWLVPQLLPVETPKIEWDPGNNLVIEYRYEFIPNDLLFRFMVRKNQYIKDLTLAWQGGVLLEKQNTKALITETFSSHEIVIKVAGNSPRELMTIITDEFDYLHTQYEGIKVQKLIPCNCAKCQTLEKPNFYEYEDLVNRKTLGKPTVECRLNGYKEMNVQELLDGIYPEKVNQPLKVFISYAHHDKDDLFNEFIRQLNVLSFDNKIEIWYDDNDNGIDPGEPYRRIILEHLEEADLTLLLVSSNFLYSKFIWEFEMPIAVKRHEMGKTIIIPIYFKPVLLPKNIGDLQRLSSNKEPVAKCENKEDALMKIASDLNRFIEAWGKEHK